MTVHVLPAPAVTPEIGAARESMSRAAQVPTAALSDVEVEQAVAEVSALESQAAALKLALAREADRRRLAEEAAVTGTPEWMCQITGDSREVMRGGLVLAELLETRCAATRQAFAAGRITLAQARVIALATDRIPDHASTEDVAAAEEWLVAKATGESTRTGRPMNPRALRQASRRMCRQVSRELADEHAGAMLRRERRFADSETWMTLADNGDGTWGGRFVIPELHGKMLRLALDRLSSPRRWSRDRNGEPVVDDTLPGGGAGLNWSEHLGAAFVEVIEHLPGEGWDGNAATVLVRIDLDHLLSGLGVATLDNDVHIDAGDARRLACNAGLIPAVFGGASVPLDLGRSRRLHSRAQRHALALEHDSCAVGGCDRPFAWCEVHHPEPWSRGGRTDLANALPLCGWHHRRAHEDDWDLRRSAAGDWRFHRRRRRRRE